MGTGQRSPYHLALGCLNVEENRVPRGLQGLGHRSALRVSLCRGAGRSGSWQDRGMRQAVQSSGGRREVMSTGEGQGYSDNCQQCPLEALALGKLLQAGAWVPSDSQQDSN